LWRHLKINENIDHYCYIKNSVKHKVFLLFLLTAGFYPIFVVGQNYGEQAFSFLQEPVTARLAALGTPAAAIDDHDINLAYTNPSLISPDMDNDLSFAYVSYFAGFNYGLVQFSHTFDRVGSFVLGVQYMDYGKFDYADNAGNRGGTFGAADYAFNIGWGRKLSSRFFIGATGKFIYSHYASYGSYGLAVDVAGTYHSATNWIFSLVGSNIGLQLKPYVPGAPTYPLPFDLSLSLSKKLEHVPFRFVLTYDHIERWDISYYNSVNPPGGIDPITGKAIPLTGFSKISDVLLRHFILGGEFLIGKHLIVRGSYNYRRRKELSISQRVGMVGFSWGVGLKISHFRFNYSRSTYHHAGSPNYLSLSMSLDNFRR
jgi:hypothetical protein